MTERKKPALFPTPNNAASDWFVVQLKPNGFERARQNLQRQGFDTFMPMQAKTARHGRKIRSVLRPLFPGYIFVRFDRHHSQWRAINNTFGVSRLIAVRANEPQMTPPELMAALQARCGKNNVLLPPVALAAGDRVRVVDGPFCDIVANVEHMTAQNRASLLLELMGRAARVSFSTNNLELLVAV